MKLGDDSIISNIIRYSASHYFRQLAGLLAKLLTPMLLSPQDFGLWNFLKTFPDYAAFSHLGSQQAARYEIPYNQARKADSQNRQIQSTIYFGTLALNAFIVAGFVIIAGIFSESPKFFWGWLAVASMVLISWYYEHCVTILKAYQQFTLLSGINYVMPIVSFVTLALVYFFSLYGLFASAVMTLLATVIYLRSRYRLPKYDFFSASQFLKLVRAGFPIMILTFQILLIRTSDRFLISYFLGQEDLGYYGISIMSFGFLMNVPAATREVIEPRLMQDSVFQSTTESFNQYFFEPLIQTAFFMPLLIAPVIFLTPDLVLLLLPRYSGGILCTQILAAGSYFFSLIYISRGLLVSQNLQWRASLIAVAILFLHLALSISLIRMGMGLKGVAIGTSCSFLLFFLALYVYLWKRFNQNIHGWGKVLLAVSIPYLTMCGCVFVHGFLFSVSHAGFFIWDLVGLGMFYMLFCIVIYWTSAHFDALGKIPWGFLRRGGRRLQRQGHEQANDGKTVSRLDRKPDIF